MLQIIIWMGCAYFLVKAFEIASSQSHKQPNGKWTGAAGLAIVVAVASAVFFFLTAEQQVDGVSDFFGGGYSGDTSAYTDMSAEEAERLADEAEAAAAEAEAAVRGE